MSYSPTLGRWTAQDPVEFDGGDVDLYRYVGNNPVNATDPLGLADPSVLIKPPIRNPSNTVILNGPPHYIKYPPGYKGKRELEPGDNHLPNFARKTLCSPLSSGGFGVNPSRVKDFNGFLGPNGLHTAVNDLLSNYPNGVPENLDVVLYVHGAPGILLLGEGPDGNKIIASPDGTGTDDLIGFLRPLLRGKESRLIIIGCSIVAYPDGSGKEDGKKLLDRLRTGLRRPIIGSIGSTGLGKQNPGLYIETGGSLVETR